MATHPAVPVVIHGLEVLLNDPKLHGNEEVTGCAVGCLYLLHKMFHGNFCRGEKEGVATGPRHLRKTQELGENARPAPHLTLPFHVGLRLFSLTLPGGTEGCCDPTLKTRGGKAEVRPGRTGMEPPHLVSDLGLCRSAGSDHQGPPRFF